MDCQRHFKKLKDNSGIALVMVIAAMSVLAVLVTEFTYVSQVNHRMAYDGLDRLKAHYLAKSALKISLLRIKAYSTVRSLNSGKSGIKIPPGILDKIWGFPFMFPIPSNLPGMTMAQKDSIEKFQKESALEGSFTTLIESESSKFNLNMILSQFSAKPPQTKNNNSSSNSNPPFIPSASPSPSPSASASAFDPEVARQSLKDTIAELIERKMENDQDFAQEYRDLRVDDLSQAIIGWSDWTFETSVFPRDLDVPPKQAPYFSITELNMLPIMDDTLYDLISPSFTTNPTPGVNVNKIQQASLEALIPKMTKEEIKDFYEYRDSTEEDHLFKNAEAFFEYLKKNVSQFSGSDTEINQFKSDLEKRNLYIVTDESDFKINVQSQVGQASERIEAWVSLDQIKSKENTPPSPSSNERNPEEKTSQTKQTDAGLKLTFMRFL